MTRRRVVVTGLGIVSPVGSDIATAWTNVLAGYSGIKPISAYDCSTYPTRFAGLVEGFDTLKWMGPKEVRRNDPFIHYGLGAAKMAVIDAGLEITDANRERIAVIVGSGIGGIGTIEDQCTLLNGPGGVKKVSPFFVAGCIINMVSGAISIELGLNGPSFGIVSACTTGSHSIGMAHRMISYGDADVVIAGGAEDTGSDRAPSCRQHRCQTGNDDGNLPDFPAAGAECLRAAAAPPGKSGAAIGFLRTRRGSAGTGRGANRLTPRPLTLQGPRSTAPHEWRPGGAD